MAYKRASKKKSTAIKLQRTPYEIDGFTYKSKTLLEYHQELKGNRYVKSFQLPEVADDAKARNGKFNSYKVTINDLKFDSIMESRFYLHLLALKDAKQIQDFTFHTVYELQPKFRDKLTGKAIRPITYEADFVVTVKDGSLVAVDVKGKETDVFKIKYKMFRFLFPDIRLLRLRYDKRSRLWLDLDQKKG